MVKTVNPTKRPSPPTSEEILVDLKSADGNDVVFQHQWPAHAPPSSSATGVTIMLLNILKGSGPETVKQFSEGICLCAKLA